jgi:hypothetical protein
MPLSFPSAPESIGNLALIRTDYISRATHVIRVQELRITKHITDATYTMDYRHLHHGLEYIFPVIRAM